MIRGKKDGLLIAGGGLAGSLAAIAMATKRPEVPLLLVEEGETFGGGRTTLLLEDLVDASDRWLLEPLVAARWDGYYVAFPGQSRKLKAGCVAVRGANIDRMVRETLRPDQYRLGTKAVAVRDNELVLLGGERIKAEGAIDARGAHNLSMLELGWHKYLGREYEFSSPHKVDRPVLMDATVGQADDYRFVRLTPFSETRLLIEDCHYSTAPEPDPDGSAERLDAYVAMRRWKDGAVLAEESGVLPVALGGDFAAFWRVGGARVAKLGLRGGFFQATTGQTLADALDNASLLAEQQTLSGEALHDLFEAQAGALWRRRELQRGFNAVLFEAKPEERRGIFESFYKLDPALIARFHSGRPGMLDRVRLGKLVK